MSTVIQAREYFRPRRQVSPTGPGQIVIDLESLILDASAGVQDSLRFTVRTLGLNVSDEELIKVAGWEPVSALLFRWIGEPDATRQALQVYQDHFDSQGRYLSQLRPGAAAVLAAVRAVDWQVHYLTHIGKDAAFKLMNQFAPDAGIHSIISSVRPGSGLMRPHLLSGLLHNGKIAAEQTLLVTDHPLEMSAAADLGVPAMALGYGRAPAVMLMQYRPAAMARNCRDAASLLRLHCMALARNAIN
ncbi:MAG: hypothetical protein EVA65_05140 [Oceanococcus sp.]|nr:MAG: hypothetical protein EVA65_05140 [Oceanococcus sp.]